MVQAVVCGFYILLFVFIIYKSTFFNIPRISSHGIVLLFLSKMVAATLLWKLFVSYYPVSDASVFFDDSKFLYDACWNDWETFRCLFFGLGDSPASGALQAKMMAWNGTHDAFIVDNSRTLIRLNTLLRFFSFGHFYVHAVIISFFSFAGFVYLYKLFFHYLPKLYWILIITLFLLPSVLFWSSTVLKEGVLFLGIGMLLYHTQLGLKNKYRYTNIIGLLLGMLVLILVKIYVLIALLPGLIANLWIACSSHRYIILKYVTTYCILLFGLFIMSSVSPSLNMASVVKDKQANAISMSRGQLLIRHDSTFVSLDYVQKDLLQPHGQGYKLKKGHRYLSFKQGKDTLQIDGATDTMLFHTVYAIVPANSTFIISKVKPSLMDMLKNAPVAFFNTLIIPSLFSLDRPFSTVILVQHIGVLLYLFLISVFFMKRKIPLAITLFCFSFVILLFSLIGLTTPVLGALVRYRIPGIPFLIIGFTLMADESKILRLMQGLKANLFNHTYPKK